MSEVPTWDKVIGALGSTTSEFGGSWANLISDYYNGVNIGLLDPTKLPIIGSLTRFKSEKIGIYDTDASHYVVISPDDIDTGGVRKVKIRRMNSPNEEDYMVFEAQAQTLINKILTAPVISSIVNGAGTLTLPTSTDTLIGRSTTDTIINKTIDTVTSTVKNSGLPHQEVFLEGSNWTARNTKTGAITSSGTTFATVLQAAINTLTGSRSIKETVKVKGSPSLTTVISIPSYTVLDLKDAKITLANSTATHMFVNSDISGGNTQIEIIGGYLDGNKSNQAATPGDEDTRNQIQFTKVTNCIVTNMYLINGSARAIRFNDCINATASFNTVIDTGAEGIQSKDGSDVKIINNTVKNTGYSNITTFGTEDAIVAYNYCDDTVSTATSGINISSIRNKVIGNSIRNSGGAAIFLSEATSGYESSGVEIIGNDITGSGGSAGILASGYPLDGAIISGNRIYSNFTEGIRFSGAHKNISIVNNLVYLNGNSGIYVSGTAGSSTVPKHVQIVNNIAYNNGTAVGANDYDRSGISARGTDTDGVSDIIIQNNTCYDDQGSKTQKYGVRIQNSLDSILQLNNLKNNLTDGLASVTNSNLRLFENIGYSSNSSVVTNNLANTFGAVMQTFRNQQIRISDPTNSSYVRFTVPTLGAGSWDVSFPALAANDEFVMKAFTQTLTNKTLTAPVISTIVNTGTLTLPTATDTLMGRTTTDTMTNKTLTAPTINAATLTGVVTLDATSANYVEFVKTFTNSSAEVFLKARLSEDTGSFVALDNATSTNAVFAPHLYGRNASSAAVSGLLISGQVHTSFDSGTKAALTLNAATHAGGALSTRPMVDIASASTIEYTFSTAALDVKNNNIINSAYHDFTKMTAPGNPAANDLRLYVDTADTHMKIKNSAGTVTDLNAAAATALTSLTDVVITTPSNGQALKYDSGTSKWTNQTDATGGGGIGNGTAQQIYATNAAGDAALWTNPVPQIYDYIISKVSTTYYATKHGETIPKYSNTALHTLCASIVSDLGATGGTVAFAANTTFSTSGGEILLADNITWKGMDRITSVIKSTTNHQIFRWYPGAGVDDPLLNAGVTDLHFIIHDTLSTKEALYVDGSVNFKFNRNWVESKGSSGSSIPATGVISTFFDTQSLAHFHYNLELKDNWYSGYQNGQDAFGSGNVINGIVTGNTFKDHTDGQAMGPASAVQTIFANNSFYNTGNMIGFETNCHDNIISNNIGYNTTGIKLAGDGTSNISARNLVDSNIIIYGAGGIEAGNCYYDTISNNKIVRTATYGIRGALHNCTIRGNDFIDTNHSNASTTVNGVSNTRGGIMIINNTTNQPDSDNNIIQNNKFVDTGATFTDPVSATSKSGNTGPIVLDTNCNNTILLNNQFTGLVSGTVVDYGLSTINTGITPDVYENSKYSELMSELNIPDGSGYGSGIFASSYATAQGTTGYDFGQTLPSRHYTTGAVSGNTAGKTNFADTKRNMLPKIFAKFRMNDTSNHALFIGWATGFNYDAVHATTPLNAMMGIGVAAITGVTNFRVIHNDASGACTSLDTTVALDTNWHTIEIWTDNTNWYYNFDRGVKTGTITTDMPDATTNMYLHWTNLTNTTATKKFNIAKLLCKIKGV